MPHPIKDASRNATGQKSVKNSSKSINISTGISHSTVLFRCFIARCMITIKCNCFICVHIFHKAKTHQRGYITFLAYNDIGWFDVAMDNGTVLTMQIRKCRYYGTNGGYNLEWLE